MGAGHHGVIGHGVVARPAGQVSHQAVSKPLQGEHRGVTQSKAFGATVAAVADRPNILHGARHGVVGHGLSHGVVGHGVAHGVVGHGLAHGVVGHGLGHGVVGHGIAHPVTHAIARPVVHAAPAYHAPVVAHAVAHPVV